MYNYILHTFFPFVANLTWDQFSRLFWFFLIFDFPRYVFIDFLVMVKILTDRVHSRFSKKQALFDHYLEKTPPLVSVIIPALNEAETIPFTIQSVLEQSYKNMEIILVDDGSTDHTPEIVKQYHKTSIQYFRLPVRSGKSAALNYGIRRSQGEFIIFLDSDTTFERDSFYRILRPFSDPKVGAVSGNLYPRNIRTNLLTICQSIEYLFTITVGRIVRARLNILCIISGAFGAFRRSAIDLNFIGGHEPGPGNDSDITIRVRKSGYRIEYVYDAICRTDVPTRISSFLRQRWRWDRNLIKNRWRKHRNVLNPFWNNFNISNCISFIDVIFFHCIMAIFAPFYIYDIITNHTRDMVAIFLLNYIIYIISEFAELTIVCIITKRWDFLRLSPYIFVYNIYHKSIKFSRICGYMQELFFFQSYRDTFAPKKVRERMIRW